MLGIRDASMEDMERIMAIYSRAQDFMIRTGNPTQWAHSYPGADLIAGDIASGRCKVICDDAGIHGVFALCVGDDPTYGYIEDGGWLNDAPYAAIHRVAGDGIVHGIFRCAADYCKGLFENVRIDTHFDNKTMQRQIEKNGFTKCGVIYVEDGSPRLAYHWTKK